MRFQSILFDLDGTLTDPKEGITTSVQYALKSFGIEEPNLDRLTPFIGPPLKESFMEYYGFSEKQAEEAVEKYREWFSPKGIFQNRIYDGIPEMLQKLSDAGKILAVASSKPGVFVEKILRHFDIYDVFDVITGSELDGRRTSKEEVVEEALRQLSFKTDREHTVMAGDRKYDISGGKAHGLCTVGCTYGYAEAGELAEAGADFIVNTVEELEKLLLE